MAGLWLSGSSDPGLSREQALGSVWVGQLDCPNCLTETVHEVRYVAGLLHQATCTACGQRLEVDRKRLRDLYLRGLPRRILSKPGRLAREARHDPMAFVASFPIRVLTKAARVAEEAGTVAGVLNE